MDEVGPSGSRLSPSTCPAAAPASPGTQPLRLQPHASYGDRLLHAKNARTRANTNTHTELAGTPCPHSQTPGALAFRDPHIHLHPATSLAQCPIQHNPHCCLHTHLHTHTHCGGWTMDKDLPPTHTLTPATAQALLAGHRASPPANSLPATGPFCPLTPHFATPVPPQITSTSFSHLWFLPKHAIINPVGTQAALCLHPQCVPLPWAATAFSQKQDPRVVPMSGGGGFCAGHGLGLSWNTLVSAMAGWFVPQEPLTWISAY